MLARLRMTPQEIWKAIVEVDDHALSIDDLEAVMRNLPTADEVGKLSSTVELD